MPFLIASSIQAMTSSSISSSVVAASKPRTFLAPAVREHAAGLREGISNMPAEAGAAAWKQHYDKLDQIARSAR